MEVGGFQLFVEVRAHMLRALSVFQLWLQWEEGVAEAGFFLSLCWANRTASRVAQRAVKEQTVSNRG